MDKYFKIVTNNITPAKGRLLISEPLMGDFYFGRSVVLLAEHNDEGSFGLVLNKPVERKFNNIVKGFPDFDGSLFIGGPVETDSLFYIHSLGDMIEGSLEIGGGLYWGGDIEIVKELMLIKAATPENIRFSIGYSGWSPEQLKDELKRNSWVVSPEATTDIFKIKPQNLWKKLLQPLGDEYSLWPIFPVDPGMN